MTRIILVRHGQTDWNAVERFRGRADIKLNAFGRRQTEATAITLARLEVDAVYTSPLARATETAAGIAKVQTKTALPHQGIIDIDYGAWEGYSPAEVSQAFPELYRMWLESPASVSIPGGEDLNQVSRRAAAAVQEMVEAHRDATLVVVSHKVVNKCLLCSLIGIDLAHFWQLKQSNCGISELAYANGTFKLEHLNDVCHLVDLP